MALSIVNKWVETWEDEYGFIPDDEAIEFHFGSEPIWEGYYGGAIVSKGLDWHTDSPIGFTFLNVLDNPGYLLETDAGIFDARSGVWTFDSKEPHRLLRIGPLAQPFITLYVEGKRPKWKHMELVLHKLIALDVVGAKPSGTKWNKEIKL
ncbi:MAG: hypothetical protein ACO4CS_16800 [bacterium]